MLQEANAREAVRQHHRENARALAIILTLAVMQQHTVHCGDDGNFTRCTTRKGLDLYSGDG